MPRLGIRSLQRPGIALPDFHDALNACWLRSHPRHGQTATRSRIAIAVSGGVDSMALAKLCSMLKEYEFARQAYGFQFQAFIVDHKAREGSRKEAESVKTNLSRMGMAANILTLEWPIGVRPLDVPNFETHARRLRYQALGAACRAESVTSLLLAHHADDQAETVFMRLVSGQKGVGLRGIQGIAEIPECHGKHGINESGYYERATMYLDSPMLNPSWESSRLRQVGQQIGSSSPIFEGGGVKVMRPLLKFTKQDLIDTCNSHSVVWMEDETNKDAWRTPRNAIRSLLGNFQLPLVLRKRPLLRLSEKMRAREATHLCSAFHLFEQCDIMLFDVRSGSTVVRLPKHINTEAISQAAGRDYCASGRLIASLLIRKLADPITPLEEFPLNSLQFATTAIFPEPAQLPRTDGSRKVNFRKFTAAGVQFECIHSPLAKTAIDAGSNQKLQSQQQQSHNLDLEYVWKLTRQPFKKASSSTNGQRSSYPSADVTIPGSLNLDGSGTLKSTSWSAWHLWDGRFWIRVLNRSIQALQLRPFREADLQALRARLRRLEMKQLEEVLTAAAPDKVRWTLPVISHFKDNEDRKSPKVVGLPTLGKAGIFNVEHQRGERNVEWEVRYKHASLGKEGEEDKRMDRNILTSWKDS